MNKQTTLLVGFALVLAALYIAYFTDWFKPKNIQIVWRISPATGAVAFYLDKPYPVTSISVVSSDEAKTNKYPHALWHVVPQTTPTLVSNFNYGSKIHGMKPDVSTALPEPLSPGEDYSLIVQSGTSLKGEKSFSVH
jgi:hypothetical protein